MLRLGLLSPETVLHVDILCLPTDAHSLCNKHFPPPPPLPPRHPLPPSLPLFPPFHPVPPSLPPMRRRDLCLPPTSLCLSLRPTLSHSL